MAWESMSTNVCVHSVYRCVLIRLEGQEGALRPKLPGIYAGLAASTGRPFLRPK